MGAVGGAPAHGAYANGFATAFLLRHPIERIGRGSVQSPHHRIASFGSYGVGAPGSKVWLAREGVLSICCSTSILTAVSCPRWSLIEEQSPSDRFGLDDCSFRQHRSVRRKVTMSAHVSLIYQGIVLLLQFYFSLLPSPPGRRFVWQDRTGPLAVGGLMLSLQPAVRLGGNVEAGRWSSVATAFIHIERDGRSPSSCRYVRDGSGHLYPPSRC